MIVKFWEIRLLEDGDAKARERRVGKDGMTKVDTYTGSEITGPIENVRTSLLEMSKSPHPNRALLPISADVNEVWW